MYHTEELEDIQAQKHAFLDQFTKLDKISFIL